MAQYIEKDALLAEIERRKEKCDIFYNIALNNNAEFAKTAIEEQKKQYNSLKDYITSHEMKEINLDEEIETEYNPFDGMSFEDFERIAKYFFELGLKAQKG